MANMCYIHRAAGNERELNRDFQTFKPPSLWAEDWFILCVRQIPIRKPQILLVILLVGLWLQLCISALTYLTYFLNSWHVISKPVYVYLYTVRYLKYLRVHCKHSQSPTSARLPVTSKLISIFTFTAEGPRLVVADSVGAADLRVLSALVNV